MTEERRALEGCCAIVTGGASGIGAASAKALSDNGAAVAIADMDGAGADVVASRLPGSRGYKLDVSDPVAVGETFEMIDADFGRIDILVNNAGIGTGNTLMNMTFEDWSRVIDVNLSGPFYCIKAALPALARQGGSIINIASIAGKRISHHGGANYTASKSGLLGLTRHAAFELARYNIRVNAICPGPVMTPMVQKVSSEAERRATEVRIPLGAWVEPRNIADMVVFLAGPGSAMCTGSSFDVDGGMLVSNGTPYEAEMARRGQGDPPAQPEGGH